MSPFATAFGLTITSLLLMACDPPINPTPVGKESAVTPAPPVIAAASTTPPAEEVKLMKEFWETGKLKYWNEMRKDANGKWQRTGLGRAYYSDGILEREGMYKEGTRVGIWKYFGDDGSLARTEDRGTGAPGGA